MAFAVPAAERRAYRPREPLAELATTDGGFRFATSVGGVLTGRGADVILIDDPLKPADAMSQSRRAAANDWFDSTLYSRLNDKQKGAIVIVMQRLHEDDLAGHVLGQGGWEVVSFPAVAEDDETHAIETPRGPWTFRRSAGAALDPAREPLPILERIRATIGEYNFAAQYQQRPAPAGGGMIKAAWLQRFRLADPPRVRPHRAELGHRQQALRACRLFRLHHLGPEGPALLPLERPAQEALLSRAQARGRRAERAVRPRSRS